MSDTQETKRSHRWSGWPGAWCLDCGCDDPYEIALADDVLEEVDDPTSPMGFSYRVPEHLKAEFDAKMICPEPGSNRHNPYTGASDNV